jgi:methionine-rich copper-binding protein CopC
MKTFAFTLAAAALLAGPALANHPATHAAPAAHGAAHGAMLKASSPANGATVSGSPRALSLTFAHPMTLNVVALTGPDGKTRALPVAAAGARAQASVALPPLSAGAWRAAWKATGADGHAMTGLVRFTVR